MIGPGAGSVVQHLVANGGNTQPPLFKAAITSSTYMDLQYKYNDRIPEVGYVCYNRRETDSDSCIASIFRTCGANEV